MINVFTLIGIAFSFFAILLIVYGLIFILRDYKNVNKAEWRKYQIRYYKDTIDSMLYDTNNSGTVRPSPSAIAFKVSYRGLPFSVLVKVSLSIPMLDAKSFIRMPFCSRSSLTRSSPSMVIFTSFSSLFFMVVIFKSPKGMAFKGEKQRKM